MNELTYERANELLRYDADISEAEAAVRKFRTKHGFTERHGSTQ